MELRVFDSDGFFFALGCLRAEIFISVVSHNVTHLTFLTSSDSPKSEPASGVYIWIILRIIWLQAALTSIDGALLFRVLLSAKKNKNKECVQRDCNLLTMSLVEIFRGNDARRRIASSPRNTRQ